MNSILVPKKAGVEPVVLKGFSQIDPPFGYFGSKNRIALKIANCLPPHNAWVDLFCGSAAVTLAKRPAPIEIINDKDKQVVNLFRQLRSHADELCRLVSLTPYSRQEFNDARDDLNCSPLEKARRFLISSMMAINGAFGKDKGGFSYSHSYSRNNKEARVNRWVMLPERLSKVVDRLRNIRIENMDAIRLLKMYVKRPATLIYMDPPYLAKRLNGYTIEANDIDFHHELLKTCLRAKCMIFISGYENDLYTGTLSKRNGWEQIKFATQTRGISGKDHDRTEVIWKNQFFCRAERTNRVPIRLSRIEQKEKKLNPERN